jgi:hypothetical protein
MKLNSVAGCTDILLLRNAEGRHWATFVERLIRQQKYVIKKKKEFDHFGEFGIFGSASVTFRSVKTIFRT